MYNNTHSCAYDGGGGGAAVIPHTYLQRRRRTTTIRRKYYNIMSLVTLQTTKWQYSNELYVYFGDWGPDIADAALQLVKSSEQIEISKVAALRIKCIIIGKKYRAHKYIYTRKNKKTFFREKCIGILYDVQ